MKIPLIDLTRQYPQIADETTKAIADICASQRFILGPWTEKLEADIVPHVGGSHAVACSSGTDALVMAMLAAGIGPGDEVITSPFTFVATAGAIRAVGARPVFVDIKPDTFCIDPQKIHKAITVHTAAIIPVHLFGQCCDMDAIMQIAEAEDLIVIEDACQAIGATWRGQLAGSFGDYAAFSFFPSKNLGAFGDAGLVCCREGNYATLRRLQAIRTHGGRLYEHHYPGGNFRMDEIQAAVLSLKLPYLTEWQERRAENANAYHCLLNSSDCFSMPYTRPECDHAWNQYTISVIGHKRDELRNHLTAAGIGTGVYYPIPLHLQPCFADLGYKVGDLHRAERAAAEVLSLPIYPDLNFAELQEVTETINAYFRGQHAKK